MGNNVDEEKSFCRDEETARRIAFAQYTLVAKSLLSPSQWKKQGVECGDVAVRVGDTASEFADMIAGFWRSIPECAWLVHKRKRLIGGSIILPLTPQAYERLHDGSIFDTALNPETDLTLPSRHFYVMAMTILPEIAKPRLPGLRTASQIRKILQHVAVLLGDEAPQDTPVRLLTAVGPKDDEKAVERQGFTRLNRHLYSTQCPLFEMITPAPETTISDYSSAASTLATLIGTQWRMRQRK